MQGNVSRARRLRPDRRRPADEGLERM